jgi:hypothetical protein
MVGSIVCFLLIPFGTNTHHTYTLTHPPLTFFLSETKKKKASALTSVFGTTFGGGKLGKCFVLIVVVRERRHPLIGERKTSLL